MRRPNHNLFTNNLIQAKICQNCGRSFNFRSKWKNCWEQVRYCSEKCRQGYNESRISFWKQQILANCNLNTSVCPSFIAIKAKADRWKAHLEFVRQAARLLVNERKLVILQGNKIVNPSEFRGLIRLKLKNDV